MSGDPRMKYVVHVLVGQDPVRVFYSDADDALRMAQWLLLEHGQEARVEDILLQNLPTRSPHEVSQSVMLTDALHEWEKSQVKVVRPTS